jgi:hypothetical protein
LSEDFELDWRAGAILIFTIEAGKVRDIEYMKKFVDTGKMTKKTLLKHRKHLIEHGLLEKDYDREVDSIIYSVPKQYRHLAQEEELRRSIDEGKPFSVKLQKGGLGEALIRPLAEMALTEYPPKRELVELAAWIKREPSGWAEDDDVKNAKLCLEHCLYFVPEIKIPYEDPDSYVFVWSDEAVRELGLQEPLSSRFFDLKDIYDAMMADLNREVLGGGPVFVGAYCTPVVIGRVGVYGGHMRPLRYVGRPSEYRLIEQPQSVCVAVRREADTNIRVVHVEPREGKLNKAWVSGLAKQLKAKKDRMLGYDSLKEDAKRRLLLNLRSVFEQRGLSISSRYASLIEDLWEYSYRKPSSGYVLALAIAVDLCSN